MTPLLALLVWSTLAALGAGLGGVVSLGRREVARTWLGWANALAAGLMFGAAYALLLAALDFEALQPILGAFLGVAVVHGARMLAGTSDLDLNRGREADPGYGRRIFQVQALHAAWEGVAVGAAAALDLRLGLFLLGILALHNIAEGILLIAVLRGGDVGNARASGLAVLSNGPQVLMAWVTLGALSHRPTLAPWVAGFAVGALVHLVLVELLPEAYREAGPTSIAMLTSAAIGVAVLLLEWVS